MEEKNYDIEENVDIEESEESEASEEVEAEKDDDIETTDDDDTEDLDESEQPADVAATIRNLKFRKKMIGGVDEEDVWLKFDTLVQDIKESESEPESEDNPEEAIKTRRRDLRSRALLKGALEKLLVLAIVLVVLFFVLFGVTPMKGDDMEPGLSAGDLLLYYRLEKEPKHNDVLVIERGGTQYVGRVVGLPNDMVIIMDDGRISVNGNILYESKIFFETKPAESAIKYPLKLKDDEYFIMGDKRDTAKDSRVFGPVTKSEVKGKVLNALKRTSL